MRLLLVFVVVPAVELYLLINVGSMLGPATTIGLIVVTGVLGWSLVKRQGFATITRIQEQLAMGVMPAKEMVGGLCLVGAGIVLVTPGFITDAVGFLILVPPVRRSLAAYLLKRFRPRVIRAGASSSPFEGPML